jgi:medium-chain acyl-[acyl-carrier-protein] hydrolase
MIELAPVDRMFGWYRRDVDYQGAKAAAARGSRQRNPILNIVNDTTVVSDRWVSCLYPKPQSRIRLFCFPFAGAGASVFNSWSRWLSPEVELFLVNLPGRDSRIREEPYRQLKLLVDPLTQGLLPYLQKPSVFFGHSMGSLITFEVARELRRLGSAQPLHLFVSGRRPPQMPDPRPHLHQLPEADFLKTTQQFYGALPEIILQDPELVDLFLSIMRADMAMIETYQYTQEAPLACPISVYGGAQDITADEQILAAWKDQTAAGFRLKMFPGEHFFIQTARASVLQVINAELATLLNGLEQEARG